MTSLFLNIIASYVRNIPFLPVIFLNAIFFSFKSCEPLHTQTHISTHVCTHTCTDCSVCLWTPTDATQVHLERPTRGNGDRWVGLPRENAGPAPGTARHLDVDMA